MSNRGELILADGRALSSLRVVDLKEELEKRGLSKSGSKKDLSDRLRMNISIEREREEAARSEGLPNISMQDKLAEQNPFILEYFAAQAEQFHSQSVVKQLYREEKQKSQEREGTTSQSSAPAPTPTPVMAAAEPEPPVVVHQTPLPPPPPVAVELPVVPPPAPVPVVTEPEPPVVIKESSPLEPEKKSRSRGDRKRRFDVMEVDAPASATEEKKIVLEEPEKKLEAVNLSIATVVVPPPEPQETAAPAQRKRRFDVEPPPPSVVEDKVVEVPQPSQPDKTEEKEKPNDKEQGEPKTADRRKSSEREKIEFFSSRSRRRSKELPPPEEPKAVELVPEPIESSKGEDKGKPRDKEEEEPKARKSSVREKIEFFSNRGTPKDQPPLAKVIESVPQPAESAKEEKERRPSKDKDKDESKMEARKTSVREFFSNRGSAKDPPPPAVAESKAVEPEEKKAKNENVHVTIERKPSVEENQKQQSSHPKREPIVFDLNEKSGAEKKTRSVIRFDSTSSDQEEKKADAVVQDRNERFGGVAAETKTTKLPVRERIRLDSSSSTKEKEIVEPVVEVKEKEEESSSPGPDESKSHRRLISLRSTSIPTAPEGIDDDALDYGDEDKVFEPPKYIWTPRILRLDFMEKEREQKQGEEVDLDVPVGSPAELMEGDEQEEEEDDGGFNPRHVCVTSELLLKYYPGTELIGEDELKMDVRDKSPHRGEGHLQITRTISNEEEEPLVHDNGSGYEHPERMEIDVDSNEDLRKQVLKRTISLNLVPTEETEKELTPPRNSPTDVIIVTNLVRPFTLIQLRELLQRTGNIADFWVDKIKSKCIVRFEKEDEAFETRAALHGVRWPTSNPKTLHVDFTCVERLENLRSQEDAENKPKVEEKPQTAQMLPVREWDLGKRTRGRSRTPPGGQHRRRSSRSASPDRKRTRRSPESSRIRRTSRSPQRDRRGKEHDVKKEPEASGKALDELFRKTVAIPCIYWLPLTPQQISEKEELRRKRMLERERRVAEIKERERAAGAAARLRTR